VLEQYDDFLDLRSQSFRNVRLIVFAGVSGSGKSSAIEFLRQRHPDFVGKPFVTLLRTEAGLHFRRASQSVVWIDEVNHPYELKGVARLMRKNQVVIATHLPLAWYLPLRTIYRTRICRTDRGEEKIARFLHQRELEFSAAAVRHYCRSHGANYLDIQHILERCPDSSFDRSYALFQRLCKLRKTPWGGRRGWL
jgi:hypothetical protein